jgi:hypothetical protein
MKLIIPEKITHHVPKPTKAQLINALVARAREQHDEQQKQYTEVLRPLYDARNNAAYEALAKITTTKNLHKLNVSSSYCAGHGVYVSGYIDSPELRDIDAQLRVKLQKYRPQPFDEKSIRREITASMAHGTNPLDTSSTEVKKALDEMLRTLLKQSQLTIEA